MTSIFNRQLKSASVAAVLGLAACSGSGTSPQSTTTVPISKNVLQFAVGTANIYGDLGVGAGAATGLNVATTYRQPSGSQTTGDSGSLVNSVTLTIPAGVPAPIGVADGFFSTVVTGPSATEVGGHSLTSTPQAGSSTPTTFGTSGGAFGLGLAPFNYNEGGAPDGVAPYVVPLYDHLNATIPPGDPNSFVPWGGPPAFDPAGDGTGVRDESVPAGTLGVPEGLDVFEGVSPAAGSYQLTVSVPANTGTVTQSATATISATGLLGSFVIPTPTLDGSGGASIPITLPRGVSEGYIQITDVGPTQPATGSYVSCNGSDVTPTYYTIFVSASGTYTLPPNDATSKAPSLCTTAQNSTANSATGVPGDNFVLQLVGFDYPWFQASYPNSSGNPSPAIAGGNGQSDITISSAAGFSQPAGSPTIGPAIRNKSVFVHRHAGLRAHR